MFRILILAAVFTGPVAAAETVELKDIKMLIGGDKTSELAGYSESDNRLFFYINAEAVATYTAKEAGTYKLVLEMSCDPAKKEMANVKITVGDTVVEKSFDLTQAESKSYEFKVELKKGENKIKIEYLNDEYSENEFDRNLYLHSLKLDKK